MTDFLRERLSLSAPHSLCQSAEVATSFPFVDSSSGSGWGRGKDPRPPQPEEVSASHQAWQGTLPEDQPRALLYSLAPNSLPPANLLFRICSPTPTPTGSPDCADMCGPCLTLLEKHRPFRGMVQTFFKFVTPMVSLHRWVFADRITRALESLTVNGVSLLPAQGPLSTKGLPIPLPVSL